MRSRIAVIFLTMLLAVCVVGILRMRFEGNDLVPDYSSLQYGPKGVTVLFDALRSTGAVQVSRSNRPVGLLKNTDATLVIAGADRFSWLDSDATIADTERLARSGDRVVIALGRSVSRFEKNVPGESLVTKWGVHVLPLPGRESDDRESDNDTPARWPTYFQAAAEWHILDAEAGHALAIERKFGPGSVVLLASAWPLTNEAMVQDRRSELLSSLFSSKPQVIFDESHLGLEESGSVMALSRTFHLQGFLMGLLVLAGLFVWRNLAGFPPDMSIPARRTGRDSLTGLSILLARNVPEDRLIEICLEERQKSGEKRLRPDQMERALSSTLIVKSTLERFEAVRQELHTRKRL